MITASETELLTTLKTHYYEEPCNMMMMMMSDIVVGPHTDMWI